MISDATVELVKARTNLVQVVGETVKLTRRGRSWVGICPFHKEKSPSFHVTPERGFFHCFGCKESGNAISFVMKALGLSFPDAVRHLAERCGVEVESSAPKPKDAVDEERRQRLAVYEALSAAAAFYEGELAGSVVARQELERRVLWGSPVLGTFRVGYAPPAWDGLAQHLRRHGVSPAAAEQAGLLVPRQGAAGYYDRFRNRLMFPVIDLQGRVVAFSGRILPDPVTGALDKETGKYVNSPETAVYRKGEHVFGLFQARQSIRDRGEAVMVEGNFDVVSLHARGLSHAVAPLGTAFTTQQGTLLRRVTSRVVLLFDGDAAGRKATLAALAPCREAGLLARAAMVPDGSDPDDLARAGVDLDAMVSAAEGLLEHAVRAVLEPGFQHETSSSARSAALEEAAALLSLEPDPTTRLLAQGAARHMLAGAAAFAGVPEHRHPLPSKSLAAALALLDQPSILNDPLVAQRCLVLDEQAQAFVLAATLLGAGADVDDVLQALPDDVRGVARRRIAHPHHAGAESARLEFFANTRTPRRDAPPLGRAPPDVLGYELVQRAASLRAAHR